jgi:hypothetical protein
LYERTKLKKPATCRPQAIVQEFIASVNVETKNRQEETSTLEMGGISH